MEGEGEREGEREFPTLVENENEDHQGRDTASSQFQWCSPDNSLEWERVWERGRWGELVREGEKVGEGGRGGESIRRSGLNTIIK